MKRGVFIPEKTPLSEKGVMDLLKETTARIFQNYGQIGRWTSDNNPTISEETRLEHQKHHKVREKRLAWLKEETRFLWTQINHLHSLHSLLMLNDASGNGTYEINGWSEHLRGQDWKPFCTALEFLIKQVDELYKWTGCFYFDEKSMQKELQTLKVVQFILRLLLKKSNSLRKPHSYREYLSYLNQPHKKLYDKVLKNYDRTGDPDQKSREGIWG